MFLEKNNIICIARIEIAGATLKFKPLKLNPLSTGYVVGGDKISDLKDLAGVEHADVSQKIKISPSTL